MRATIITGAAGGIGASLCRAFHAAGYWTVGSDLADAVEHCDAYVQADLVRFCREDRYRGRVVRNLLDAIGDRQLHVLVNNAAVQLLGDTATLGADTWHTVLDVNVLAPFLLTQALLQRLAIAQGSVVNIGSIHAQLTKPGYVAYATSKAALMGLTRSLAVDLGAKVRVNALCPAAIRTQMLLDGFKDNPAALERLGIMHPAARIGNPEEVASAVLFLASSEARFINGATLGIDGGIGARLHDPL